jgi:hypothetical protein
MSGRHHDRFRAAVIDLKEKLPTDWKQIWTAEPTEKDQRNRYVDAGLRGEQAAFKVGVFTQAFDEFRDEAVLRGTRETALARNDIQDIIAKMLPWPTRWIRRWISPLKRALNAGGKVIASIISLVSPEWKERIEALKELTELAVSAIEATG